MPATPNFRCVWGTEEIHERTGGIEGCRPWISFHSTISWEQTRFFERHNGTVIGNLEGDKYFANHSGTKPVETGHTHVSGKSVRDLLRGYINSTNFAIIVSLYDHHKHICDELVRSWEDCDFEYVITANRDDPDACPLFDWDFIDRQIKAYGALHMGHALSEAEDTVIPFKQLEETNG